MNKSDAQEANSLRITGWFSFITAEICFFTFIYSFIVIEPYAIDAYTHAIQADHYNFFTTYRWLFLLASIAFVLMGFLGLNKSYRIENPFQYYLGIKRRGKTSLSYQQWK